MRNDSNEKGSGMSADDHTEVDSSQSTKHGDSRKECAAVKNSSLNRFPMKVRRSVIVAVVVLLIVIFAALAIYVEVFSSVTTAEQTLTTGVAPDGTRWELQSNLTQASLCLSVNTADDSQHPDRYDHSYGGGGCDLDNTRMVNQQYSFIMGAINNKMNEFMIFAPAPAGAATVRVAEHQTVPTHEIPGFFYKGIRYWYFVYPANWPNSGSGKICDELLDNVQAPEGHCKVQAYDRDGKVIPFGNNYLRAH
ncbi:hypothetical protein [Bifidobacterium psychraerophilum]|uniref:hypothetical protein n=1 Tax=Bifidobacterium psychraerophilum TaxID=218140 RepID=UPI0039E98C0A